MADYDPNTAHPKIPYKGTYPNMHVTQRADGSQELRSLDPGNEAYFEVQATGNYTGHGPNGEQVNVTVGKQHSYNADGVSQTTDGHSDVKISGTNRSTVAGSEHSETGGNKYTAGGGVSISGFNDSVIHHSSSDGFHTTEGDIVTDHTGNVNHNISGDCVDQVTGNKMTMIGGEWGVHLSGGNLDFQLDSGKGRLRASDDILIESDSKITLKVGSSTIVIESSQITVTSGAVKFVKAG